MNDPKPFASLGATLLARKGGAKPAMRPQSTRASGLTNQATAQNLEDLGWDDMGEDDIAANHSAEVLNLTPSPHNPEAEALTDTASPKPKVRSMHEELALRLAEEEAKKNPAAKAPPAAAPVKKPALSPLVADKAEPAVEAAAAPLSTPKTEAPKIKPEAANDIRRAAFTLRLDAKRHLKLRLASTIRNRSAQQLVTEALDRFLGDIPEIESLAAQVKRD